MLQGWVAPTAKGALRVEEFWRVTCGPFSQPREKPWLDQVVTALATGNGVTLQMKKKVIKHNIKRKLTIFFFKKKKNRHTD